MTERKDLKKVLEAKVDSVKRKPSFVAQDSHKKKRIKKSWRKPDGSDSKMRRSIKGYRKIVKAGYGTANVIKHVSRQGYKILKITSLKDMTDLIAKNEKTDFPVGLEIASGISKKTKVEIVKLALENKIHILSIKKPEEFLKTVETELKARKVKRQERSDKIKAKETASKSKDKKEKKDLEEQLDKSEDKDKVEKKEKDKVLAQGE